MSRRGDDGGARIALVCDFFYPRFGGVESHLFQLGQCLIARGHKVIVITHRYGNRSGVRTLTNNLRVYHLPLIPVYQESAMPMLYLQFPLLRNIFLRERIDIVHGHGAFSCMCHEALLHAKTMGLRTVFTDHSLFGFSDLSSILMNKVLKFSLSDIDHVICVSHISRENTVLRAQLDPRDVSVIPNAVDCAVFVPDPALAVAPGPEPNGKQRITIVVMSRLCYRKGTDLVIDLIPRVCARYPHVHWLIGGDGDRMVPLQEAIERHQLHDRVQLLGEVQHHAVASVLVRGELFLNSSLTEAFCIAIVEAASCGLSVVSTRVGGVPEVLPPDLIRLADAHPDALLAALDDAIVELDGQDAAARAAKAHWRHDRVRPLYTWQEVAERTEVVYRRILAAPPVPFIERLRRFYGCGAVAGKLFCLVVVLDVLVAVLLGWLWPRARMDLVPDWQVAAPPEREPGDRDRAVRLDLRKSKRVGHKQPT